MKVLVVSIFCYLCIRNHGFRNTGYENRDKKETLK